MSSMEHPKGERDRNTRAPGEQLGTIVNALTTAEQQELARRDASASRQRIQSDLDATETVISKLVEPVQKRKAQLLWELLPTGLEPGSDTSGRAIGAFSVRRSPNNERQLILMHPELDPELCRWLDAVRQAVAGSDGPDESIAAVSKLAKSGLRFGSSALFNWIHRGEFKLLERRGNPARIGSFLRIQNGNCRHFSTLFQLGMQEIPLEGKIVYGTLLDFKLHSDGDTVGLGLHAWNEVEVGGAPRLFDLTEHRADTAVRFLKDIVPPTAAAHIRRRVSELTRCQDDNVLDSLRAFAPRGVAGSIEVYAPTISTDVRFSELKRTDILEILSAL